MTKPVVVKTFLEKDSSRGKIAASEFMAFWKECSEQERQSFAEFASKDLGVEITA